MTPRERTIAELREIASRHGVRLSDMLGPSRKPKHVRARFAGYAVLRDRGMSLPRIGRVFCRDHSTVLHGLKSYPRPLTTEQERGRTKAARESADNTLHGPDQQPPIQEVI